MPPLRTPIKAIAIFVLSTVLLLLGSDAFAQRSRGAFRVQSSIGGLFNTHSSSGMRGSVDVSNCSASRGSLLNQYSSLVAGQGYLFGSTYLGGYSSPGPYDDSAGGEADLIAAQGHYLVSQQRAALGREHVRQNKLQTRRRAFDEYLYERSNAPTWEDDRERLQGEEARRSRNDPPLNEIMSARALNSLLDHLQKQGANGGSGPEISLDDDLVNRINVICGRGGSVALLKDGGRLHWPLAFQVDAVRTEREQLNSSLAEALIQATNQQADAESVAEMARTVNKLQQYLGQKAGNLPPGQYVAARRFLGDLDEALTALRQPDAGAYISRKRAVRGRTVAQLIRSMTEQGLHFAPAVPGDESAYLALHRALTAYDGSAAQARAVTKP